MPYALGSASKRRLATCHQDIRVLVNRAIATSPVDFTVTDGRRGEEEQEAAFDAKTSKAHYGQSPHNVEPLSLAVDLVPYIDGALAYDNDEAFEALEGHLRNCEEELLAEGAITHTFEWGGDWPGAWDKPHWQIAGWRKIAA